MTMREMLSQYCDMLNEIKQLESTENQIKEAGDQIEHDIVKGSSPYFPYTERTIHIYGINPSNKASSDKSLHKLHLLTESYRVRLLEMKAKCEEMIQSVEDSRIRQILRYKYLDGFKYQQVANLMGYGNTADNVRKAEERFWQKFTA